jgi:hypothetical protein
MRKRKNDASGPAENRTQKETTELSTDKPRDSPLPGGWQEFDDCPPPEVSSGSDARQDPFAPCNAILPGKRPHAPKPGGRFF